MSRIKDSTSRSGPEQCYFGRRSEVTIKKDGKEVKQQEEQVASRTTGRRGEVKDLQSTRRVADDLDYAKNAAKSLEQAQQVQDATVGFATAPADAKLAQARGNLGKGTVCGVAFTPAIDRFAARP